MYKSFSGNALADKMFLTVFKRLTQQSLSKHLTEKTQNCLITSIGKLLLILAQPHFNSYYHAKQRKQHN